MALSLLTLGLSSGNCRVLPEELKQNDLVFIYVHGFGEVRETMAFQKKMSDFLKPLGLKAAAVTFRWHRMKLDPATVVHQWTQAKAMTGEAGRNLIAELRELDAAGVRTELIGYSLGSGVVAEALRLGGAQLRHLRGVTFLGSALPHDYQVEDGALPAGLKIQNYFSGAFDVVLKVYFYNAEGTQAGGEAGFDDTRHFENHRTVCTHVHKGGLIQRDYSSLAPALGYLALAREKIFVAGSPPQYNVKGPVGEGSVHWNDIARFEAQPRPVLIQQNVNTGLYRAVALGEEGQRTRQAWGANLHEILKKLGLFAGPYEQTVSTKKKKPARRSCLTSSFFILIAHRTVTATPRLHPAPGSVTKVTTIRVSNLGTGSPAS